MAHKKRPPFECRCGDESPPRAAGSKRRCCVRHGTGFTLREFMEKLEPSDLQLVQQLCQKYLINVPDLSARTRVYRLKFRNKLKEVIFTGRQIVAENEKEVEIVLVDASDKIISSGPMASSEIEVVVLKEEFHGDENGEWTEEEFKNNMLNPRGKGPLLIKNISVLRDGVGRIADAKFYDNSSWLESKKIRLGVRLCGEPDMAGAVQEGLSNAFRVKDRHGENKQKQLPPSMNDAVYCLKGIFRNGPFHKKLEECKIKTVRDFLCYCSNNHPDKLRGMIGMGKGAWQKTYGHASESEGRSDILLHGPDNLCAPDQNSFEVTGSSSSHISNVQTNVSGNHLPPKSFFITAAGAWNGTERLDIPCEDLMEGNERCHVSNEFDIGSQSHQKWLKLLFVARLKVAARKSQQRKPSENRSRRHNWHKLLFVARLLQVKALRSRQRNYSETSLLSPDADDYGYLDGSESLWGELEPILQLTP